VSKSSKIVDIPGMIARAEKEAAQWLEKNKDIGLAVQTILDRRLEQVVAGLVGFEDYWGRWEVDHCNGRQSLATDWLREKASEGAKKWIAEQAANLPELPRGAVTSLRNEYKKCLQDALEEMIREKAHEDAKEMFNKIAKDVTGVGP
jgi:hypothetical protein